MKPDIQIRVFLLITVSILSITTVAQDKPQSESTSAQELADKLSNPVANMISVPVQSNLDYDIGKNNGSKYTINVQPVIPIRITQNLNLITRYIIPVIDQRDVTGENSGETGLSDATVSAWFSPAHSKNGWIWGAGPAFLIPIGTDDLLSTRKWAVGPTALALRQSHGLTYGFLVNQLWSVAGDENRSDVNQMFLQPFFSKSWKSGASATLNSEITFNWEANATIAYLNPIVSGITKFGKQTASISLGPRIPLTGPENSMANWGLRAVITLVFPK